MIVKLQRPTTLGGRIDVSTETGGIIRQVRQTPDVLVMFGAHPRLYVEADLLAEGGVRIRRIVDDPDW